MPLSGAKGQNLKFKISKQRQREVKRAAALQGGLDPYAPIVAFQDGAGDEQPEAKPIPGLMSRVAGAVKAVEHLRLLVGWDAHSEVAYRDNGLALGRRLHADLNPPVVA